MFRRIFGSDSAPAADAVETSLNSADPSGDTATVRRIVAKLEAMPPEQARLIASAAYTLARAANADLEISDEETATIERELQAHEAIDEATAVLVAEVAKLHAKTVGGTEDYVVIFLYTTPTTENQKIDVLRACYVVSAANGSISAEESAEVNQIANELGLDADIVSAIRAEFHERLTSVQEVRRLANPG